MIITHLDYSRFNILSHALLNDLLVFFCVKLWRRYAVGSVIILLLLFLMN
jgi:hypothetical protein